MPFLIDSMDISDSKYIGSKFIAIEKWFYSYGHFHDELFSLSHISNHMPFSDKRRVLLDYPDDNLLDDNNFKFNENYSELESLCFSGGSINQYFYKDKVIRLEDILLFANGYNSNNFHKFPISVTEKMAVQCNGFEDLYKKIFLTRGPSYRDFENKKNIENYFYERGYVIINPEVISIRKLIYLLSKCDSIALYWGSGMTNLAYITNATNVTVLKSISYKNEDLYLWRNFMSNRDLKVNVISELEGGIPINKLKQYPI